jgi:membrane-bound lytic murein transglycosylase A
MMKLRFTNSRCPAYRVVPSQLSSLLWMVIFIWVLAGCSSTIRQSPIDTNTPISIPSANLPSNMARSSGGLAGTPGTPSPQNNIRSKWIAADWQDLPGWDQDDLSDAWNAWLHNCERPGPLFGVLCNDVRQLTLSSDDDRRIWMMAHLRPYRLESFDGQDKGLLTSYYEPVFDACLQSCAGYSVALYSPPSELANYKKSGKNWYTRQEIESNPLAQQALKGHEVAWLQDPVDALILHIQGSGVLKVKQANGSIVFMRVSFAGSNDQPYQSVARWLLDRGYIKDASWAGIRAWVAAQQLTNSSLVQEMFWSNPRYIFFKIDNGSLDSGPKGAQGIPLTAGRSVAVDKDSVAYATPLWLATSGGAGDFQRLVFAQDTGSAIVGAVRADYFAGTGDQAGVFAGQVKQNLRLWALWPR